MPDGPIVTLSVRVPEPMHSALERRAKQDDLSMAQVMRRAFTEYLARGRKRDVTTPEG